MNRKQSPETELKRVKRELKASKDTAAYWHGLFQNSEKYRERATRAEAELIEWKRRFDSLLKILPEKS